MHGFQLRSWFWNYYYYGKDWYYQRADDPPIGFSTKWVKQRAKRVGIASEAQWAGRVLVISPATVPSLQLGVDGPRTGQGCGVFAAASSTRASVLTAARPTRSAPSWCEVDYLPGPHGSAVFTRGETQALATVTLGTKLDEKLVDDVLNQGHERFLLHYNFPPFSTGEAAPRAE